jgi:hypothetical protein
MRLAPAVLSTILLGALLAGSGCGGSSSHPDGGGGGGTTGTGGGTGAGGSIGAGGGGGSTGAGGAGGSTGAGGTGGAGGSGGTAGSGGVDGGAEAGTDAGAYCSAAPPVDCPSGQVCDLDTPNRCGAGFVAGHCIVLPAGCTAVLGPVCGCNGQTYNNDCERQRARIQLSHAGTCP